MKARVVGLLLAVLLAGSPVQAAPLWKEWNGLVLISRKYVGLRLKTPIPKGRRYAIRYEAPASVTDNWLDHSSNECWSRFKGRYGFTYNLDLGAWLCVTDRYPR
jgi:hypothetical protein